MLIAFSVENFRSIRGLQTLSLEEPRTDTHLESGNIIEVGKRRLLKTAVIFGPNASGKSNVLRAMMWFRNFVLNSAREGQAGDPIDVVPFLLSTETENAPTHFEVEFFWHGHVYRYGFRVTSTQVVDEWLFRQQPGAREAKLFTRSGSEFEVSNDYFPEGKGLEARTRVNALFLSVCAQLNGPTAMLVLAWMLRLRSVSGINDSEVLPFTARQLEERSRRSQLVELARQADFNITGLRAEIEDITEKIVPAPVPDAIRKQIRRGRSFLRTDIKTAHEKRGADGKVVGQVEFDLERDESQGTQKFVALSGPITHTLEEGSILIVDEFEARLHPRLTQAIFDLFQGPANAKKAQPVCATHDVTLLDPERFRRDQVWFCEKDEAGATKLFSLAEFDPADVRPTTKFGRQYMLGLFGAVPRLANFQDAAAHVLTDAK
jgi:energy-coupling factor transporter ATP-binding protein EcfA2